MSLRPTFMGFETAARGVMINQKAMDIVANNVANVGVTGYTRQRVDQVSMAIDYRNSRHVTKTALNGQGATIAGISQMRDPFLDKRFREEYGDVGYYQTISEGLEDLTAALSEIQPEQMTAAMEDLRSAIEQIFSQNGMDDPVIISGVRSNAREVAQVFQQFDAKLKNVWEQQKFDLSISVDEVNEKLQSIANLNDAIRKEQRAIDYSNSGYYGPNELMDQRNVLIDELSAYGNVVVKNMGDGTVEVSMNGHVVVQDTEYEVLNMMEGSSDHTVRLTWNSTGEDVSLLTGSLKGSLDMLNGRGLAAQQDLGESSYQGILYYQDKIDTFAAKFAEEMNHVLRVASPDDPSKPKDPAEYKQLFTFGYELDDQGKPKLDDNGDPIERPHTAANIMLSDQWEKNVDYFYDGIVQNGSEDNTYATLFKDLFEGKDAQVDFGEFKGSFKGYISFYTNTLLGTQTAAVNDRLESAANVSDNLLQRIASISGVSYNEEAADQMAYQKAYDAMCRVMTAMDELLDKLINGTGRVGL